MFAMSCLMLQTSCDLNVPPCVWWIFEICISIRWTPAFDMRWPRYLGKVRWFCTDFFVTVCCCLVATGVQSVCLLVQLICHEKGGPQTNCCRIFVAFLNLYMFSLIVTNVHQYLQSYPIFPVASHCYLVCCLTVIVFLHTALLLFIFLLVLLSANGLFSIYHLWCLPPLEPESGTYCQIRNVQAHDRFGEQLQTHLFSYF